jgi:hypothetical protein
MSFDAFRHRLMIGILTATLGLSIPAGADEITPADLHAIVNALGFLNGLPHGAPITVGLAFGADIKAASQTGAALEAIPGPAQSSFKTIPIAVRDLMLAPAHFDVLLIMPDAVGQVTAVAEAARHRKLMTVATDVSCLEHGACVLMVHSAGRVHIVLDTQLANAVGANFSSVFTMMVERK